MLKKLEPTEKKVITGILIAGALGGLAYLILQNRNKGNLPQTPQTPQGSENSTPIQTAPQLPAAAPKVILPLKDQYNINTPLCYKNEYTKMTKTLQSIINQISKRNLYPLIKVDGIFGIKTLKYVRAYFGGSECVTLKKAFSIRDQKQIYNKDVINKIINAQIYV